MIQIDYIKELIEKNTMVRVVTSPYISDYKTTKRSWKERLFTLPLQPLRKTNTEYNPIAYIMDGNIVIVSYRTWAILEKEGLV